jgi:2-polyprenyl-3-methyl-5-hydroxy-6-metoxy-1,4-benzoquinol methylase
MLRNRRMRESIYTTADYWDAKAIEHEGDAVSMWPNNHLNLPQLQRVRVLDVGCGTGRISRWLAAQGATVVGIDFSARSVEIARRLSEGDNPTYRV